MVNVNAIDGRSGRRVVACINPMPGGAGGSAAGDGTDGSGANEGALKNTPVEISELEAPVRIRRYELACDTGGVGQHRGGLGTTLEFTVFSPGTRVTARNRDRTRFSAWGLKGGKPGSVSAFVLNPGTPGERHLGNTDIIALSPGDTLRVVSGGGGGFGNPVRRDPERVLSDVRQGRISIGAAKSEYGVVLSGDAVDADATASLRAAMIADNAFYNLGEPRRAFETVWNEPSYDALTAILAELPVHWRFFVKHAICRHIEQRAPEELAGDGSDIVGAWEIARAQMANLSSAN
jgi:N-methylhydantoinase B